MSQDQPTNLEGQPKKSLSFNPQHIHTKPNTQYSGNTNYNNNRNNNSNHYPNRTNSYNSQPRRYNNNYNNSYNKNNTNNTNLNTNSNANANTNTNVDNNNNNNNNNSSNNNNDTSITNNENPIVNQNPQNPSTTQPQRDGQGNSQQSQPLPPPPKRINGFNFGVQKRDFSTNGRRYNNYNNSTDNYQEDIGGYRNQPYRSSTYDNSNNRGFNNNRGRRNNYSSGGEGYNNNASTTTTTNNYGGNNRSEGYNNNYNRQYPNRNQGNYGRRNNDNQGNYYNNNRNQRNQYQDQQQPKTQPYQQKQQVVNDNPQPPIPQPSALATQPGIITTDLRRVLSVMSDDVRMSSSDEEILNNPNIGINLLGRPMFGKVETERKNLMNVPMNLADFLIEGLAVDQPQDIRFSANKIFRQMTTMTCQVPIPLPISVDSPSPDERKTLLGFFDTNSSTANEAQERITSILNTLAQRQKTVYRINEVDRHSFSKADLYKLSTECNVVVLMDDYQLCEENETISFTLHVLQHDFDQKQEMVNQYITEMFEKARIYECPKCLCYFCIEDGSLCQTIGHRGNQIPFEGGEMESVDLEDGEPVYIVNYDCCGECIKGEPGCGAPQVFPCHDVLPERVISHMSSELQPVYVFDQ